MRDTYTVAVGICGVVMAAASIGIYSATRAGLRAFLAPTVEGTAASAESKVAFDAVAVTLETRLAVAAMAALPFLSAAVIHFAHLGDAGTLAALALYSCVAIAGAVAFRRASRIAIGVDGIFVTGSSRSRFFAYRDLDAVTGRGSDVLLVKKGRTIVRLQLHGEDASQKDAILLRIQSAIEAARQRETAAVGDLVASVSEDQLARVVQGADGYRSPSVSRTQLWSLVEGHEHDAEIRISAARALVATGDPDDRKRLRFSAERSAEPRVRATLTELSLVEDESEAERDLRSLRVG
jgi:hypothetical protein